MNEDLDKLRDTPGAAEFLRQRGLKRSAATLEIQRCMGGGPVYLKIGRSIRYRERDLLDYLNGLMTERRSTSEIVERSGGREPAAPLI